MQIRLNLKIKISFLLFFLLPELFVFGQNEYPQLFDGSGGIQNGYGAWGTYQSVRENSVDVPNKGVITFYHPQLTRPRELPVVIFISGWGQTYQSYDRFFKFVASLGYSLINIYNYDPGNIQVSYNNSLDMIRLAQADYSAWLDTTKVGLTGHSYGGGSIIWLGKHIFDPDDWNWGTNGKFLVAFAPWLSFLVTGTDLQNYPVGVKMLMIQSRDDFYEGTGAYTYNTDPRALRAVYQLINIPDSDKDFVTVFSDVSRTYVYNNQTFSYLADHYVSYTDLVDGDHNPFDAYDVYLSNRLFAAMADLVFNGNATAAQVALGNGSAEQVNMHFLPDLDVTDYYVVDRPEQDFAYRCSENTPGSWGDPAIWKLQNYCVDSNSDGIIDALGLKGTDQPGFQIYPNPAKDFIMLKLNNDKILFTDISIYTPERKLIKK